MTEGMAFFRARDKSRRAVRRRTLSLIKSDREPAGAGPSEQRVPKVLERPGREEPLEEDPLSVVGPPEDHLGADLVKRGKK